MYKSLLTRKLVSELAEDWLVPDNELPKQEEAAQDPKEVLHNKSGDEFLFTKNKMKTVADLTGTKSKSRRKSEMLMGRWLKLKGDMEVDLNGLDRRRNRWVDIWT